MNRRALISAALGAMVLAFPIYVTFVASTHTLEEVTRAREKLHDANEELKTLDEMAKGGMYDQLGGGFHRYSVDERWFVRGFVQNIFDSDSVTGLYVTDASSGLFTNIFTLDPRRYGIAIGAKSAGSSSMKRAPASAPPASARWRRARVSGRTAVCRP